MGNSNSFGALQGVAALKGFEVWSNYFSNRAEVLSSLRAGDSGDIVMIIGHGATDEEVTECGGIGTNEFFFWSNPISGAELTSALSSDGDPPSVVAIAGCLTADLNGSCISGGAAIAAGYTISPNGYQVSAPVGAFVEGLMKGETIGESIALAPGSFLSVETGGGVSLNDTFYDLDF